MERAAARMPRIELRPMWPPASGTVAAVAVWAVLIAAAWGLGTEFNSRGAGLLLHAPPLHGRWDVRIEPGVILAVLLAAAIVWGGPLLARAAGWRRLLILSAAGAFAWALALALAAGTGGVLEPLRSADEYLTAVPLIGSPGDFLSHFTERIGTYATHVRGHPPGMALVFWGLAQVGLGGSLPAALLVVGAGASAVPAALIALRETAGEERARAAAPYLVLAPAAVWIAVSADAFFTGVSAWAACLLILALHRRGWRSRLMALGGGLLFGACLFLSYGLILIAVIPLMVAANMRRFEPILWGAAGGAAVVLGVDLAGFWIVEGFRATRSEYLAGVAMKRPYDFFLLNNLAALGLVLGPATAVAFARIRDRRILLLAGGAAAAVLLANLSGMSKGEVERIWLPFVPWLLLATASLPARLGATRCWLTAQALCAVAIQVGVRTPW